MREIEIGNKLTEWSTGGPNGPLGKWVDAIFDGTSSTESSTTFKDKLIIQKTMLHGLFKEVAEHAHASKVDLLRATYALLLFPELKIPLISDTEQMRQIAGMIDPRLRDFVARTKLIDFLEGHPEFIRGLHIDESEAKREGASQRFWVHAFYSMSVSVPLALTSNQVVTASQGNIAQSALMIGQVLRDIAKYLKAKPKVKHEDMGCEIAMLTTLFDDLPDEAILTKIGFDKKVWSYDWQAASKDKLGVLRDQLQGMGVRIATMIPHYWLFSRGYRLPIETIRVLKEYLGKLNEGLTGWDSIRNAGRWLTGTPPRTKAVIEQESRLIAGILRCDRLGFLNLRTLHQFIDNMPDAVNLGDAQTKKLHSLAKKAVRRELYIKSQHLPGPGIHISATEPVMVKIQAELKRKSLSIPSVGKGGSGPTKHMLLYGVAQAKHSEHVHSQACGRAQKAEVYRFIDEHSKQGSLSIKALLDLLVEMCCFEWKLGCQKSPLPDRVPAHATLLKDEIIYWVVTHLCTIAGGYGERQAQAMRDATRLAQRDGVLRFVREQYDKKTLDLDTVKFLINEMSWYTWDDFVDEAFVTWMPIGGASKLIEQARTQEAGQFEAIRDFIIRESHANTLSLKGLKAEIESSGWYTWEKLKTQSRIPELTGVAGANAYSQVLTQIESQLSDLYVYIKSQKYDETLSLVNLENELCKFGWYSWDEFKKHAAVDFLDATDAQTLWEQVVNEIDKQDAKTKKTVGI